MPSRAAPTRVENLLRLGGDPDEALTTARSEPCDVTSEVRPVLNRSRRLTRALAALGRGYWSAGRTEDGWSARAEWEDGEASYVGADSKEDAEEQLAILLEEIGVA